MWVFPYDYYTIKIDICQHFLQGFIGLFFFITYK